MTSLQELTRLVGLVARQVAPEAISSSAPATDETPACDVGNEFDGRLGVRISAIFVILVGSLLGKLRYFFTPYQPIAASN